MLFKLLIFLLHPTQLMYLVIRKLQKVLMMMKMIPSLRNLQLQDTLTKTATVKMQTIIPQRFQITGVSSFLETTCSYRVGPNEQPFSNLFTEGVFLDIRSQCMELTYDQLDMFILGNRGYYMAAQGYEFYLQVLKVSFTSEQSDRVRDTFSTRR